MAEPLLAVEEALARVLAAARRVESETVPLTEADGRTLAAPLAATRTQPPFASSAMDGYAVRAKDLTPLRPLRVIGAAPAGRAFSGRVGAGEAVRIFTGAPLPDGADTVIIQETVSADGDRILPQIAEPRGSAVRPAGLDFAEDDVLLAEGLRLNPRAVALAAAMGHARLPVYRKPRVALLATGDELVLPGESARADQIVASNIYAAAAMAARAGAETLDLGIARDTFEALEQAIDAAEKQDADILVTLGGASVGEHDLVQSALTRRGMQLGFWRIAMRPGKPLIFGHLGKTLILGLPGNPVSAIVCARLFLEPLIRAMQGDAGAGADPSTPALLARPLAVNDARQDYLRARVIGQSASGLPLVAAFDKQDSSMLRIFTEADALIVRPPRAPEAAEGEPCRIIRL
jgi:molybdopterin molybdotransferase